MSAPSAEILTIGTELLLGQIVDTNTARIARGLRDEGINLYRTSTVGDNRERIASALRRALESSELVITTGGLGPTADDVTREAIADALGVDLEFRTALWRQIEERFARYGHTPGPNNRRQARIPRGASPIENPVGTAPAFLIHERGALVIALPGVPAEMMHLLESNVLPALRDHFALEARIYTRILRVVGVGESDLDAQIEDLEALANPTVGVSAHPGRVDIRLGARADRPEEARAMLEEVEKDLRGRLGDLIYGTDDQSLESVALEAVKSRGWSLVTQEAGSRGALAAALSPLGGPYVEGRVLGDSLEEAAVEDGLREQMRSAHADAGLLLHLRPWKEQVAVKIRLDSPDGKRRLDRSYGGPRATAADWGVSLALDLLRRI